MQNVGAAYILSGVSRQVDETLQFINRRQPPIRISGQPQLAAVVHCLVPAPAFATISGSPHEPVGWVYPVPTHLGLVSHGWSGLRELIWRRPHRPRRNPSFGDARLCRIRGSQNRTLIHAPHGSWGISGGYGYDLIVAGRAGQLNVVARGPAGCEFLVYQSRGLRGRVCTVLRWPELFEPARESVSITSIQNLRLIEGA